MSKTWESKLTQGVVRFASIASKDVGWWKDMKLER